MQCCVRALVALVAAPAALLTSACGLFEAPTAPRDSSPRIAFVSNRDGPDAIYTMRADGSDVRRLTTDTASSTEPSWSPDHRRLAFVSTRDGNPEIYVMDADGGAPTRLTTSPGVDRSPAWSPDGQRIAFISDRDGAPACSHSGCIRLAHLYMMSADGSNVVQLGGSTDIDRDPAWSPDGRHIAFGGFRGALSGLLVMDVSSDEPARVRSIYPLDGKPASVSDVAWSPDGRSIAFANDGYVLRVDADGGAAVRVAGNVPAASNPSWSSDGRKLVFAQGADLYSVDAGGGVPSRLTHSPLPISYDFPVWSPDGRRLAVLLRGGVRSVSDVSVTELLTMAPDGTQQRVVFADYDSLMTYAEPVWSPDGQRIALRPSAGKGLRIVNADGSGSARVAEDFSSIYAIAWDPASRRIDLAGRWGGELEQGVFVLTLEDGSLARLSPTSCFEPSLDWSPDGRELAYACTTTLARRVFFAPRDGGAVRNLDLSVPGAYWFDGPHWSPDGRELALTTGDGTGGTNVLSLVRADDGGAVAVYPLPAGVSWWKDLRWNKTGDRLASTGFVRLGEIGLHTFVGLVDVATGVARALTPVQGPPEAAHPSWSSDSGRLAWASGSSIVTANADGGDMHTIAAAVPYTTSRQPAW